MRLGELAEQQILRRLPRRQHAEEILRPQHPVEQLPERHTQPVGSGDVDVERIQIQHEDAVARVLRELEPSRCEFGSRRSPSGVHAGCSMKSTASIV